MAPHSSTLAWKMPWTEEPGGLPSRGSHRVGHDWATSLSLFTFMHWRRKWQPAPVFLPGESQGRGSLVGCCLWGCTESDTTEATAAAAAYMSIKTLESPQSNSYLRNQNYWKEECINFLVLIIHAFVCGMSKQKLLCKKVSGSAFGKILTTYTNILNICVFWFSSSFPKNLSFKNLLNCLNYVFFYQEHK